MRNKLFMVVLVGALVFPQTVKPIKQGEEHVYGGVPVAVVALICAHFGITIDNAGAKYALDAIAAGGGYLFGKNWAWGYTPEGRHRYAEGVSESIDISGLLDIKTVEDARWEVDCRGDDVLCEVEQKRKAAANAAESMDQALTDNDDTEKGVLYTGTLCRLLEQHVGLGRLAAMLAESSCDEGMCEPREEKEVQVEEKPAEATAELMKVKAEKEAEAARAREAEETRARQEQYKREQEGREERRRARLLEEQRRAREDARRREEERARRDSYEPPPCSNWS